MAQNLTEAQKMKLYERGHYTMSVPPVCTARWNPKDWIRWVDQTGHWLTKTARKIIKGNPNDKPMIDCDYYLWLKDNYDGHRVRDLKGYLFDAGFVRGRDIIPTETIRCLGHIHDQYFFNEIRPDLPPVKF